MKKWFKIVDVNRIRLQRIGWQKDIDINNSVQVWHWMFDIAGLDIVMLPYVS